MVSGAGGVIGGGAIGCPEAGGGIEMTRYGFNIRTRSGQRVDNICIMASNQADAERRLRQMYHHCEIVHCQTEAVNLRNDPLDL
jgi:hypothetical protein